MERLTHYVSQDFGIQLSSYDIGVTFLYKLHPAVMCYTNVMNTYNNNKLKEENAPKKK